MTTEAPEFPETMYPPLVPLTDGDRLTTAIERLATAIEQLALAQIDARQPAAPAQVGQTSPNVGYPIQPATPNVQPLAPLPSVNPQRPACPRHGVDKVKPSTKKGVAFYCSAKDPNGQWCQSTWS